MTEWDSYVEDVLCALARDPVRADAAFKRRLVETLLTVLNEEQQQRPWTWWLLRWRKSQMKHRPQFFARWAFVMLAILLVILGGQIQTSGRVVLQVYRGEAQIVVKPSAGEKNVAFVKDRQHYLLAAGEHIVLSEDTGAVLSVAGSRVELMPGTQVTLTEFQPPSLWSAPRVRLNVAAGEVLAQVKRIRSPKGHFEVEMPAATVSVRGTVFRARVISPTHTYVATDEGLVTVTLNDPQQDYPQIYLPAGYEVDAIIGSPLLAREQVSVLKEVDTLTAEPQPTQAQGENRVTAEASMSIVTEQDDGAGRNISPTEAVAEAPITVRLSRPVTQSTAMVGDTLPTATQLAVSAPTAAPISVNEIFPHADLSVEQALHPNPAAAGEELRYVLSVENHGPSDARGIFVSSSFPAGVHIITATTGQGEVLSTGRAPSMLLWKLDNLRAGERRWLYVDAGVREWVTRSFTITVMVQARTFDHNPANNEKKVFVSVSKEADLGLLRVDLPPVAVAGEVVTCSLSYRNTGPAAAQHVTVTTVLPFGLQFGGVVHLPGNDASLSVAPVTGGAVTLAWPVADVSPGVVRRLTFTATVVPSAIGELTVTASITSTTLDTALENNTSYATITVAYTADLEVIPSCEPSYVLLGDVVTCTLSYTNHGPWPARTVRLAAHLPEGLRFGSVAFADADLRESPRAGAEGPAWVLPWMMAGETRKVVFTATVTLSASPLRYLATLQSETLDPLLANNEAEDIIIVVTPSLKLRVSVAPTRVVSHMPFTYTFYITNTSLITFPERSLTLRHLTSRVCRMLTATVNSDIVEPFTWRNEQPLLPGQSLSLTLAMVAAETQGASICEGSTTVTTMIRRGGGQETFWTHSRVYVEPPAVEVAQRMIWPSAPLQSSDLVTLAVRLQNTGPSPITFLPLSSTYRAEAWQLVAAVPMPIRVGTGMLIWPDLAQPSPLGFGHVLTPNVPVTVTLTFSATQPAATPLSLEHTVTVTRLSDVYGNTSTRTLDVGLWESWHWLYLPLITRY